MVESRREEVDADEEDGSEGEVAGDMVVVGCEAAVVGWWSCMVLAW